MMGTGPGDMDRVEVVEIQVPCYACGGGTGWNRDERRRSARAMRRCSTCGRTGLVTKLVPAHEVPR